MSKINYHYPERIFKLLISCFLLFNSIIFAQEQDEIKYDFSNFRPLTPEKFIENNYLSFQEYYKRAPNSISDGVEFQIIRPPNQGDRGAAGLHQLYHELVASAVLEWAHTSDYEVGYTVYGSGYNIYQRWNDMSSPSISGTSRSSLTRADKSVEEYFRENNKNQYERRLTSSVVGSSRISSIHSVLSSETESLNITRTRDSVMTVQRIMRPEKNAPRSEWIDYFANNSNNYSGTISLIDSKYGSWSGSIGKYSRTSTVIGDISPLRAMFSSMIAYCDIKINEAQVHFYQKMGIELEEEKNIPDTDTTVIEKSVAAVILKPNKNPVINFDINTVSGESFTAPVWLKFYPGGTYDPDGKIVLFEMDMDGDGIFDITNPSLQGGSYEFTMPGKYSATVRVTDDDGGITFLTKAFVIADPNTGKNEVPYPVVVTEVENIVQKEAPVKIIEPPTIINIPDETVTTISEPVIVEAEKPIKVDTEPVNKKAEAPKVVVEKVKKVESIIEEKPVEKELAEVAIVDATGPVIMEPVKSIKDNYQLNPLADTYIFASSKKNWNQTNWGGDSKLVAGWDSKGGGERIYLKFDMPDIDPNDIKKAILKLYHYDTDGKNRISLGVFRVNESWKEGNGNPQSKKRGEIDKTGALTWVNKPSNADELITQFKPDKKANKWIEVDITQLVKGWLSETPNYGLVLTAQGFLSRSTATTVYFFHSNESDDKTKIPVLEIQTK